MVRYQCLFSIDFHQSSSSQRYGDIIIEQLET